MPRECSVNIANKSRGQRWCGQCEGLFLPDSCRSYAEAASQLLMRIIQQEQVILEWDVAKESMDAYNRGIYSPRLDIAVGPFNIDTRLDLNNRRINAALRGKRGFMRRLESNSVSIPDNLFSNRNPRCFLAIEIEKTGSRKHRLGSIINAGALGKVGVVVGWDEKVTQSLSRLQGYLDFLWKHKKGMPPTSRLNGRMHNVFIIKRTAFLETLRHEMEDV